MSLFYTCLASQETGSLVVVSTGVLFDDNGEPKTSKIRKAKTILFSFYKRYGGADNQSSWNGSYLNCSICGGACGTTLPSACGSITRQLCAATRYSYRFRWELNSTSISISWLAVCSNFNDYGVQSTVRAAPTTSTSSASQPRLVKEAAKPPSQAIRIITARELKPCQSIHRKDKGIFFFQRHGTL